MAKKYNYYPWTGVLPKDSEEALRLIDKFSVGEYEIATMPEANKTEVIFYTKPHMTCWHRLSKNSSTQNVVKALILELRGT